jgi:hypothetical protein
MTRRTLKSFGPVTLIDTRIWDNRYLVTGPSGDRSFDDMAFAETYFVNESLKDLDRGGAEPAAPGIAAAAVRATSGHGTQAAGRFGG